MAEDESSNSSPIKPERNPWVLPGMLVWAFAPAVLMTTIMLDRDMEGGLVQLAALAGVIGMPIVLYAWSVTVLLTYGKGRTFAAAALLGIPLSILMCIANSAVAFAGCSALSQILPK